MQAAVIFSLTTVLGGAVVGDAAAQRYQSLGIDIETVKEQLLKGKQSCT